MNIFYDIAGAKILFRQDFTLFIVNFRNSQASENGFIQLIPEMVTFVE
jgi:hypothetical protein